MEIYASMHVRKQNGKTRKKYGSHDDSSGSSSSNTIENTNNGRRPKGPHIRLKALEYLFHEKVKRIPKFHYFVHVLIAHAQ